MALSHLAIRYKTSISFATSIDQANLIKNIIKQELKQSPSNYLPYQFETRNQTSTITAAPSVAPPNFVLGSSHAAGQQTLPATAPSHAATNWDEIIDKPEFAQTIEDGIISIT